MELRKISGAHPLGSGLGVKAQLVSRWVWEAQEERGLGGFVWGVEVFWTHFCDQTWCFFGVDFDFRLFCFWELKSLFGGFVGVLVMDVFGLLIFVGLGQFGFVFLVFAKCFGAFGFFVLIYSDCITCYRLILGGLVGWVYVCLCLFCWVVSALWVVCSGMALGQKLYEAKFDCPLFEDLAK